jgi:outer membrane protein
MRAFLRATPVALLFLAALGGQASAQSGQKFAYIKSSVLLDQAPGRAEAEAQFDRETGGFRDQIKRMSDSLNAMVAAYEKAAPSMSATARDTRGKEIQAREAEYQRRTRELEQRAQSRQAELVQPILDRVKASIEDVRVEGGYAFIFNMDQGSPILAADKNLDLTDRVLMKLRSTASAPRPATSVPAAAPAGVTRPATPPID